MSGVRDVQIRAVRALPKGSAFSVSGDHVRLGPSRFEQIDLSNGTFGSLSVVGGSILARCDFTGTKLPKGSWLSSGGTVEFEECTFDRTQMREIFVGDAVFTRCKFLDADLSGTFSWCGQFIDCAFTGRLADVSFFGRPTGPCAAGAARTVNRFEGNDFSRADMYSAIFTRGINVTAQRLPDTSEYTLIRDFPRRLELARRHLQRSAIQGDFVHRALAFLRALELTYIDQRDVFARRHDAGGSFAPEVLDVTWSLLEGGLAE